MHGTVSEKEDRKHKNHRSWVRTLAVSSRAVLLSGKKKKKARESMPTAKV
jgi:hypothetical protein